jgi:hypothetical protein
MLLLYEAGAAFGLRRAEQVAHMNAGVTSTGRELQLQVSQLQAQTQLTNSVAMMIGKNERRNDSNA